MGIHCLICGKTGPADAGSRSQLQGSPQEEMDLLGDTRPGCILLKHKVSAESSLHKLLDMETFWRLLSNQIARVGRYP